MSRKSERQHRRVGAHAASAHRGSAFASDSSTVSAAPVRGSIISPIVDFLSVGGLSLLVMIPMLLSGRSSLVLVGAGAQAWITTAINMPHFMASYRLVYRSRESVLQHKWAAIYVPLILLLYVVIAAWEAQYSQAMAYALIAVSSVYLAWHYTGQVWGMMAAFAFLDGTSFDPVERRLVRTSLRLLLAWHVCWFLYTQLRDPSRVAWLYQTVSAATVLALGLGIGGLVRMARRTGRRPPLLAIVAWISIFVWYAVMARDPKALFWVQTAHALQYLVFPVRMELNRTIDTAPTASTSRVIHMALYAAGITAASVLMSRVVPNALMGVVADAFGEEPGKAAPILLLMCINIHHYFTDGVLWKLRNPTVRKALFAHVELSGNRAT